jgi:hypothetical protein
MPSVPQAVIATSKRNGARARPRSEYSGSRIIFPDVGRHHAALPHKRQSGISRQTTSYSSDGSESSEQIISTRSAGSAGDR